MKFLGLDIGAGSIKAGIVDEFGFVEDESTKITHSRMENSDFQEALKTIITPYLSKYELSGIGVGSPGPIDIANGIIFSSANLPKVDKFQIKRILNDFTKMEIEFNNDANCASLGEYYFGEGKGSPNLFVFTLGTGLGGGWVWNGKLFNGFEGNGMEVGHTTIIRGGALCGCGNLGCAESYFSSKGLLARYKDASLSSLPTVKDFFEQVRIGDENAKEILNFGVEVLAEATRNIVNLLNVDTVVYVGGLSQSWDLFGDNLEKSIRSKVFPVLRDRLQIRKGKNQAILGAVSLLLEKRNHE